jgi:hypothetical protein
MAVVRCAATIQQTWRRSKPLHISARLDELMRGAVLRALLCCHLALFPLATTIQAAWRALPTKRWWQRVCRAARVVARVFRGGATRQRWQEVVQGAVLQRTSLRWLARRRFVRLRCAAKLVSLYMRLRQRLLMRKLRERYLPFEWVEIVRLQCWWRAVLQRRLYMVLRGEARLAGAAALQLARRAAFRSNPDPNPNHLHPTPNPNPNLNPNPNQAHELTRQPGYRSAAAALAHAAR